MAGGLDLRLGGERDLDFGAAGEDRHFGVAVGRRQFVGAAAAEVVLLEGGPHRRQVLPGQRQQARAGCPFERQLPAFGGLDDIGRPEDQEVGDGAQRGQLLDRLMGRAVLAEADRIVGHHEDDPVAHQRREADRRPGIVAEHQEGAGIGNDAAMQRHAVHRRGHAVLADAPVDVAAGEIVGVTATMPFERVLFEGERSAEPPIVSGTTALMTSSAISEALRVATLGWSAESFFL